MMKLLIKQNDESRASNTTLTDDGELTVALDASSTYFIDMMIIADSNATADFKYAFVYTGTISSAATSEGAVDASTPGTGGTGDALGPCYNNTGSNFTTPVVRTRAGGAAGTLEGGHVRGVIVTGTSGNLKIQWAQNVSDVGNTTVHKGSYIAFAKQADMEGTLIVKSGDTSRSSNNTPSADPDLQFPTVAGKKYIFELFTVCDASSITPDILDAVHDAQSSLSAAHIRTVQLKANNTFMGASDSAGQGYWHSASFVTTPTNGSIALQNTTNRGSRHILGSHQIGGSDGTFSYDWSQATSNATATIVRAPSWLLYQEVEQP